MDIKIILNDIIKKISFLDKNIENPYINENSQNNPFSVLYNKTYVWLDVEDDEY